MSHAWSRRVWVTCLVLSTCISGAAAAEEVAPQSSNEPVASTDAGGDSDGVLGNEQTVAVSDRGRVQLHVSDLPLSSVLRMLSMESRRNIIASPGVTGTVTANLYDVTFAEALDAVLLTNGAGYRKVGNFVYVYTLDEIEAMAANVVVAPETKVFALNYLSAVDATALLEPLLGSEGESGATITSSPTPVVGLDTGSGSSGGISYAAHEFLVVTAPPDLLDRVERVIRQCDVRPKQVLVEATILRAQLTDDNALGIDFSIVGGVDLEELGGASQSIKNLTLGALPTDRFELFNTIAETDFSKDVPDGGITVGVIKDHVAVFLRALEQVTDTTVLANPKVLALNRQQGQVIVGRRDGYLTTTVTETQAVQSVKFLETGTQLVFRPFIGSDGFIRMELHPEDSVGFVNAQGLPSEQTTEVTTNIIVRDGDTILIAGLFREVTKDARNQVPGLGNLPGIGPMFRSKSESTSREEVIILLTVHVVKDHAEYADASMTEYQNVERLRVGIRQGLMWHGAERIAQRHYHDALDSVAAGDLDKAVWHVDMALHAAPRFVPAIRLRERLLGEREWDDDGNPLRTFLHRQIAKERGDRRGQFGRPVPTRAEIDVD